MNPIKRYRSKINRRKSNGIASVELALILPLLLSLIFVMVEASVAFYDKAILTHASREAARLGVLGRTPAMPLGDVEAYAVSISEIDCYRFRGRRQSHCQPHGRPREIAQSVARPC